MENLACTPAYNTTQARANAATSLAKPLTKRYYSIGVVRGICPAL